MRLRGGNVVEAMITLAQMDQALWLSTASLHQDVLFSTVVSPLQDISNEETDAETRFSFLSYTWRSASPSTTTTSTREKDP